MVGSSVWRCRGEVKRYSGQQCVEMQGEPVCAAGELKGQGEVGSGCTQNSSQRVGHISCMVGRGFMMSALSQNETPEKSHQKRCELTAIHIMQCKIQTGIIEIRKLSSSTMSRRQDYIFTTFMGCLLVYSKWTEVMCFPQQLKSLGYLCGLVSEKGPNSEDLNRTVDLLAGLGAERPETGIVGAEAQ